MEWDFWSFAIGYVVACVFAGLDKRREEADEV
jgi:hypothetical protein